MSATEILGTQIDVNDQLDSFQRIGTFGVDYPPRVPIFSFGINLHFSPILLEAVYAIGRNMRLCCQISVEARMSCGSQVAESRVIFLFSDVAKIFLQYCRVYHHNQANRRSITHSQQTLL
ncbi:MAG: hypothetical protein DWI02_03615 [Planctomycetota bacterium]|nr:MAG: hypothetical protein DWI02_03615 [Planctomycetota bacterium]